MSDSSLCQTEIYVKQQFVSNSTFCQTAICVKQKFNCVKQKFLSISSLYKTAVCVKQQSFLFHCRPKVIGLIQTKSKCTTLSVAFLITQISFETSSNFHVQMRDPNTESPRSYYVGSDYLYINLIKLRQREDFELQASPYNDKPYKTYRTVRQKYSISQRKH